MNPSRSRFELSRSRWSTKTKSGAARFRNASLSCALNARIHAAFRRTELGVLGALAGDVPGVELLDRSVEVVLVERRRAAQRP